MKKYLILFLLMSSICFATDYYADIKLSTGEVVSSYTNNGGVLEQLGEDYVRIEITQSEYESDNIAQSKIDNAIASGKSLDDFKKVSKALALLLKKYCNALEAGTYTEKSNADLKADFKSIYNGL